MDSQRKSRLCNFLGCTKRARPGGIPNCVAHGGGYRCKFHGCTKAAVIYAGEKDFCLAHGGGKRCKVNGCTKSAAIRKGSNDRCVAHGGGCCCKVDGCTVAARNGSQFCYRHGAAAYKCSKVGCSRRCGGKFCTSHQRSESMSLSEICQPIVDKNAGTKDAEALEYVDSTQTERVNEGNERSNENEDVNTIQCSNILNVRPPKKKKRKTFHGSNLSMAVQGFLTLPRDDTDSNTTREQSPPFDPLEVHHHGCVFRKRQCYRFKRTKHGQCIDVTVGIKR